jgi:hypothetical protein
MHLNKARGGAPIIHEQLLLLLPVSLVCDGEESKCRRRTKTAKMMMMAKKAMLMLMVMMELFGLSNA